jgi:MoaE-MoaD fusion protein
LKPSGSALTLGSVQVNVLYFAVLRERVGRQRETFELPPGSTIADVRAAVATRHAHIAPLLSRVQSALNRKMVVDTHVVTEGDELALLPPVAGGSDPRPIAVTPGEITVDGVVAAIGIGPFGAVVTFAGVVRRDGHHLRDVVRLEYEAYVEMAEAVLAEIAEEIAREWPGTRIAIHHRLGALAVGDVAVAIAAAAAHRAPAFDACRAAIDRLKARAPIWKKEIGETGEAWLGLGA